ncbi:MAG: hypothetical protein D6795_14440, partial [Deltaproteobacteria bacterium]
MEVWMKGYRNFVWTGLLGICLVMGGGLPTGAQAAERAKPSEERKGGKENTQASPSPKKRSTTSGSVKSSTKPETAETEKAKSPASKTAKEASPAKEGSQTTSPTPKSATSQPPKEAGAEGATAPAQTPQ